MVCLTVNTVVLQYMLNAGMRTLTVLYMSQSRKYGRRALKAVKANT